MIHEEAIHQIHKSKSNRGLAEREWKVLFPQQTAVNVVTCTVQGFAGMTKSIA